MNIFNNQPPIDLVYLWCDDSDAVWHQKRMSYMPNTYDNQAVAECRFKNYNELQYSLRSVAQYAPWINHIYIISDNQIPVWLNLDNPKISIIKHSDILPADVLPVFNSEAIELAVANIPNLSEHFLLANDDTFIGAPVTPSFFFTDDGKAIIRLKKRPRNIAKSLWKRNVIYVQNLMKKKFGKDFNEFPHHNIDAYLKSDYLQCLKEFPEEAERTLRSRFRKEHSLQRTIFSYYMLYKGHGVAKIIKDIDIELPLWQKIWHFIRKIRQPDSYCGKIYKISGIEKVIKNKIKLFCLNSDLEGNADNIDIKKQFERLYPEKCEFEKKQNGTHLSSIGFYAVVFLEEIEQGAQCLAALAL